MPPLPLLLERAIVRRVDLSDSVAALEVRLPGETLVVLVGIARKLRGVGIVTSEARRAAWKTRLPQGVTRSRTDAGARVEGGRVVGVSPRAVEIDKDGARWLRTTDFGDSRDRELRLVEKLGSLGGSASRVPPSGRECEFDGCTLAFAQRERTEARIVITGFLRTNCVLSRSQGRTTIGSPGVGLHGDAFRCSARH
jgi:hypothetical protein